jgi:hypothetical protein
MFGAANLFIFLVPVLIKFFWLKLFSRKILYTSAGSGICKPDSLVIFRGKINKFTKKGKWKMGSVTVAFFGGKWKKEVKWKV